MNNTASDIIILTGAGISAESGLATFRDKDGLWEGHRVEEVATPEAFQRDPDRVHRFYNMRRAALASAGPNAAHLALARLCLEYPGRVSVITQNVDDLHERAGCTDVIHMHGELRKVHCTQCLAECEWLVDLGVHDACPACGETALRPDIVWFGEIPYHLDRIAGLLVGARLFAAIGTSGVVYPAAGFARTAAAHGARTVEINTAATLISGGFNEHLIGPAGVEVPRWVAGLLAD